MDLTAALRAFVRTVERGSMTDAARDLRISQPAVSKLLRNLERHAGTQLIDRTSRAVRPTAHGVQLYTASGKSLATIDAAFESLRQELGEISGTLRLHAPVCLGESHLHRIAMRFQDQHPAVSLDLTLDNRPADLTGGDVDLAIRIGRSTNDTAVVRKIGVISRILVASPAYLSTCDAIRGYAALTKHPMIVTDAVLSRKGMLSLCRNSKAFDVAVRPVLKTNNARVLVAELLAGRGIGPVQLPLITEEMQSGKLIRILPQYQVPPSELYVAYREARHLRPAVRSFIDFAVPALRQIEGIA